MLKPCYQPLSDCHPDWGEAALLPWDAEILGFSSADYRAGSYASIASDQAGFTASLGRWSEARGVEVVVSSVPAGDRLWLSLLPKLGFLFFDQTYTIVLPHLQVATFPELRVPVRQATAADRSEIERIAEHVFHFGRYHADPYVPEELANKRYRIWLSRALDGLDDGSRMYVTGAEGATRGFCHAVLDGETAHVTIFAVDRKYQRGITGYYLLAGALSDLKRAGLRRADSKISVTNIAMLNLAATFGVRAVDPQAVYYWHAPNAVHLRDPEAGHVAETALGGSN